MDNLRDQVKNVLEKGYLLSLATIDEGGPWIAELRYIFDDELNLFWISDKNCRHSKAVAHNSQVAGTIVVNYRPKTPNLCIQIAGHACEIPELEDKLAKEYFKHHTHNQNDEFYYNHVWYKLKPSFIELTDETLFGYTKKKLEFK